MRWVFGICVVASLIMTAVALHLWGAAEIRANAVEVLFLTFAGVVWLTVATRLFPWLGLSLRDDAVERGNIAALPALCGAVMAVGIIYAGGSLGEGPSFMNNFFSAAVGTAGWFALWILLEFGAKVSRSIAEERDLASGLRLGGLLLAIGLILGRAAAGNWNPEAATIQSIIHDGWPAGVLWGIALLIERFARPSRRRPFPAWPNYGLLPALFYLALAAAWVWHLGAWEGMPR
ncbi:MAG TPA: hypothetical protein VH598_00405 [Verrucomicrobiae bacterium]|nr:hypothetical protein [Verrucomicrobiae bacterium]